MPNMSIAVNAVLGGLVITIGLWLMLGELPLVMAVLLALLSAGLMVWRCPTITHVWMMSTLVLGLESLAWPMLEMAAAQDLGPEPPLEELQRLFTAVLFGLFSGVFWLTFSYGLYKRTRPAPSDTRQALRTQSKPNKTNIPRAR